MAYDAIEGRLHGAGRNTEGLNVIRADSERDCNGDKEDLQVVGKSVGGAIGF